MPTPDPATRVVFGFHPVRELLRHQPQTVTELQVAARPGRRRSEIEALARRHRVAVAEVPRPRLDELAAGLSHDATLSHNGFAALCRTPTPAAGDASGDPDFRVLAEDVQDPRNLGALLRVCEGAGVGRVLIRDRGSAPLSPAAVRTSAGAAEWLPVERVTNPAREIAALQDRGFWVYGADAAGDPPWEVDLTGKIVLCFGGEESGLRALTRKRCDRLLGVPMRGRVASLNVATAASALLYEALRQRMVALQDGRR